MSPRQHPAQPRCYRHRAPFPLCGAFWVLAFLFALLIVGPKTHGSTGTVNPPVAIGSAISLTQSQRDALVAAYRAGAHYGLGLPFAAIVWQESSVCANAVESSAGAYGCAQVREVAVRAVTGRTLPPWELGDPNLKDVNMAIGAAYLSLCVSKFGWPAGAGCYYVGVGAAAHMGRPALTKLPYTQSVLRRMAALEKLPQSED